MIKVENIETGMWWTAIRGMRNPKNSWYKSDSCNTPVSKALCTKSYMCIGPKDLDLMRRLYKAGPEHRKFMRQIMVGMDITAPLYFWKEFDTYKVGVTSDSCSTMHTLADKEFELEDFSWDQLTDGRYTSPIDKLDDIIDILNEYRTAYKMAHHESDWWNMIQLLPSSYNQRRTITMNYENVVNMIHQRENHKLDEWRKFVDILKGLPYVAEIMESDVAEPKDKESGATYVTLTFNGMERIVNAYDLKRGIDEALRTGENVRLAAYVKTAEEDE